MVTANESATVESSDNGDITDERFDEQVYLLMQFNALATANSVKNYSNFVQLLGHPSVLFNKLLGTGVEELYKITPAQLALLQPKLRLFKSIPNKSGGKEIDIEIPFDETIDNKNLEDFVKNREQRGAGVGIQSFEWEDKGTNPGNTGLSFESTLVMVFSSMADIFNKFSVEDYDLSYADLISYPVRRKNLDIHHDSLFRIKAQVGWQVPSSSRQNINMPPKMQEELARSTITMAFTLVSHQINIEQNGVVKVTARYMGAIEGKMLSADTDILYIGNDSDAKLKKISNDIKNNREQQRKITKKIQSNEDQMIETIDSQSLQEENKRFTELIDNLTKEQASIVRQNKLQSYSNLLRALYDGLDEKRIFFIDIDDGQIDLINQLKREEFDPNFDPQQLQNATRERFQKYRTQFQQNAPSAIGNDPGQAAALKSGLANVTSGKIGSDNPRARPEKMTSETSEPQWNLSHRINFVYFGDLINAALQAMYDKLDKPPGDIDPEIAKFRKIGLENFRFLMGTVEIYDLLAPKNASLVQVPLADIPISLDLFNAWFRKNVVDPAREKYLLREFLQDICSQLIVKALSPSALGKFCYAPQNRISYSSFSLAKGSSNPLNPSASQRGNKRININDISRTKDSQRASSPEDTYQYFAIYATAGSSSKMKGIFDKDAEMGIPHFYIGSDRGILKHIELERVNIPGFKESRIMNASQYRNIDLFFSEPYNAKLTLVGCPHFKPGMTIYIDPKSLGFPASTVKEHRGLPIGGYYVITKILSKIESGKFETTISTNFIGFGDAENESGDVSSDANKKQSYTAQEPSLGEANENRETVDP